MGRPDGARASGAIVLSRSSNLGDSWDSVLVYNARGKTGEAAENVRPAQGPGGRHVDRQ